MPEAIRSTNEKPLLLVPRSNHDWFLLESIKSLRKFTASLIQINKWFYHGGTKRKYGNASICTHYIETADLAVNLGHYLNLPNEVIAFAAYAHDLIEDFRKLGVSVKSIVNEHWKGDKRYKDLLVNTIQALTDRESVSGKERHLEQIKIAYNNPLVAHIRFCDKLSTLIRDYDTLLNGEMPFGDEEKFRRYFTQRKEVVDALDISPRLKRWYSRALSRVEKGLVEYKKYGRARGKNDIMDPISFVSRNIKDGGHVTRRTLPTLAL